MFPLDTKTTERLAKVIVDIEGPYERKGWQIAELLRSASWPDAPEYDGSPRVPWLAELLEERRDDRGAVERLLCRVCDPLEYEDGMASAKDFQQVVNAKLEHEGLAVSYVEGRPVLGEVGADGATPVHSAPPDLERRLRALISDDATAEMQVRRANETQLCEHIGAHTMAIIGIGSLVEGLLLAVLIEHDAEARNNRFISGKGKPVHTDQPSLALLIDTVRAKGWIQLDATKFIHHVRDFRNYIHPRKELAEQPDFDADSVGLCWAPVHAILNDLEQQLR
ncbi:hypothetical protein [Salinactinospora qingdaonensis]|uniref:DUF4145 domain-containing protein n=1 Tax=Salinactinospora qingdaonensis TaxID=702744 RepID=A0ABP7GAK1_9ACTN